MWQGLGYYSRAVNMLQCAKYVATEQNGIFPKSYAELIKLKGIGDYTASAIASICYNAPIATVDGNVIRVLSRFFGITTPVNTSEGLLKIKHIANNILDRRDPGQHNQALMDFGAIQCKPKGANCSVCIMNKQCKAYAQNQVRILPIKIKKTTIKTLYFNYLVFIDKYQNTVVEQRTQGIWKGLYQFPLVQTEHSALSEEILHNIQNDISPINIEKYNAIPIVHKLTHRDIHATFWIIFTEKIDNGMPFSEVNHLALPVLIANFLEKFSIQDFLLSLKKNHNGH